MSTAVSRTWLMLIALCSTSFGITPSDLLLHLPTQYFNDYSQVLKPTTVASFNHALADFERETSNQILVVIFSEWPSDLVFDDYAQQLFHAAKIGQRGKDNGVLVLLSLKEGKIRIHTGRGFEKGALPNALCAQIITEDFAPQFRLGNVDDGLRQGLAAIMAATHDAFKGDGSTAAEKTGP